MVSAFLVCLLAQAQVSDLQDFRDESLNLTFKYPKAWKVSKKSKRETKITIPGTGSDSGEVGLIRAEFRGDAAAWQQLQLTSGQLSNRSVIRQYEQTVLGAPLLLTQLEFSERGTPVTLLTGLFYTQTKSKLLFNLKVPTSQFEAVSFQWQSALETFATIDGENLPPEDPSKPAVTAAPLSPKFTRSVIDDGKVAAKLPENLLSVETTVSTRRIRVSYPKGFNVSVGEDGKLTFGSRDLKGIALAAASYTLDSPEPSRALFVASGTSLTEFGSVNLREDKDFETTPAGSTLGTVWRRGTSKYGGLASLDAVVRTGDFYLTFAYRLSLPAATGRGAIRKQESQFADQKKTLFELLNGIRIELIP
jgi:hypothetical protein